MVLDFTWIFVWILSCTTRTCLSKIIQHNWPLPWCHNERDGVSNHRRLYCLHNCLSRHRSNKTSKFPVTGLCEGNSPVTGEFPAQRASNLESVFIWLCLLRIGINRNIPISVPKTIISYSKGIQEYPSHMKLHIPMSSQVINLCTLFLISGDNDTHLSDVW